METTQTPTVDLRPGQQLHGFNVKAVTPIDELRAVKIELAHPHSGATAAASLYTRHGEPLFHQFSDTAARRYRAAAHS